MDARILPSRPNLEQYKKQAKELVKRRKAGDEETLRRIRLHHPRFAALRDDALSEVAFALADAQFVIAREHGFDSWPKFARQIGAAASGPTPAALWSAAERAVIAGDEPTLARLLRDQPRFFSHGRAPAYVPRGPVPDYGGADARAIILREQQFEQWPAFEAFTEARRDPHSAVSRFEAAVDAIVTGDEAALDALLTAHPALIRERSARTHHAMLLHYVGANGIEGFRQKTPPNAVRITERLLAAGAEVEASADIYGGSRTLGLVATSIHPMLAGLQDELIAVLLEHGALLDGRKRRAQRNSDSAAESAAEPAQEAEGEQGTRTGPRSESEAEAEAESGPRSSIVNGCLANGRGAAAELLAARGAHLDLEGAAGVGRLDLVASFFDEQGRLRSGATQAQMIAGFTWACEFGRAPIVDFLLARGIDVNMRVAHHGQTGLHWAAAGGHAETVARLLAQGAAVDARDETWDATPLAWALNGWNDARSSARPDAPPDRGAERYYDTIARLVSAGAAVQPQWLTDEPMRADARLIAALTA